jgi:hypothetical protein
MECSGAEQSGAGGGGERRGGQKKQETEKQKEKQPAIVGDSSEWCVSGSWTAKRDGRQDRKRRRKKKERGAHGAVSCGRERGGCACIFV